MHFINKVLDAWDILYQQKAPVLSIKVNCSDHEDNVNYGDQIFPGLFKFQMEITLGF